MKNQIFSFLMLPLAVFILSSCNQEKCIKEYNECRDACYDKADQTREDWLNAMDDCQNEFDISLQACRELEDNDAFMECYQNANTTLQNCRDAANSAYDEGMDEVDECVEDCKTKFEDCSK